MLGFIDAYSGYNQIQMDLVYDPKKDFIWNHGNYYYNVIPFGLKNTGGTYHRLVEVIFSHQIGWNLEAYIDDMIVKTVKGCIHAEDLEDVLQ